MKRFQFIRPLDYESDEEREEELENNGLNDETIEEEEGVGEKEIRNETIEDEALDSSVLGGKINSLNLIDSFLADPNFEEAREYWPDWIAMLKLVIDCQPELNKRDNIKKAIIASKGGNFIRKIIMNDVQQSTFEEIVQLVDKYFKENSNKLADETLFQQLKQTKGESFERFTDRIKKKAKVFNIDEDQRIILQIATGAIDSEKLVDHSIRGSVTLGSLIAYGNQLEALSRSRENEIIEAETNMTQANENEKRPNRFIRKRPRESDRGYKQKDAWVPNCSFCGSSHISGRCPAYGKDCAKCKKKNHFAKVCHSDLNWKPEKVEVKEDVN